LTITLPAVSVIVTAYTMDRYADMLELLASLQAQTLRNFEIILVLEKSQKLFDKLQTYIREKGYANTRVLFNSGPGGLSYARNIGVNNAKGDILTFIDDDALASHDWLQEMITAFKSGNNIIGVTGPILPRWEDESMSWFPEEFYWVFSCTSQDDGQPKKVRNGYGTNMAFRREAFEKGGLFMTKLGAKGGGEKGKHELAGEDTEFSMRIREKTGKSILYHPGVMVHHRAYLFRLKWRFIISRAYWEGYTKVIFKKISYMRQPEDVLATEYRLLKRILLKLIPSSLAGLFRHPVVSWKRLLVTFVILICVASGYLRGSFHRIEIEEAAV
jgi:glucosyl-dolichyl phosphate glucuronosyltransferase